MGGGTFDTNSYRSYTSTVAHKTVDQVYTSRTVDNDLDPKGVKFRESRDSADNPKSTPIIVALDVTGSMDTISDYIAKQGLGTLFEGILQRKPVSNPHLMFMGVGDIACDKFPLQVSQFEADNRIVDQLTKIFLERGGGGNNHESYDFPWYFAGRHTVHDSMVKRGKRGYLFTIGDEEAPRVLPKEKLSRVMGYTAEADVPASVSLSEAQRLYDVFHIVIEQGNYASQYLEQTQSSWRKMLGQRVISLSDYKLLPETIVSAISVAEGTDHDQAISGWGSAAASKVLGAAVKGLPQGVPAPRMLGR